MGEARPVLNLFDESLVAHSKDPLLTFARH
jgi:hypothetical protein